MSPIGTRLVIPSKEGFIDHRLMYFYIHFSFFHSFFHSFHLSVESHGDPSSDAFQRRIHRSSFDVFFHSFFIFSFIFSFILTFSVGDFYLSLRLMGFRLVMPSKEGFIDHRFMYFYIHVTDFSS